MKLNDLQEYFFKPKARHDICLDYYPSNHKCILDEIEKYCLKENLSCELIGEENDIIVKIDNVLCSCTASTGGRASNYVISCVEI
ncbi:MAG: DUF4318 domain-containing protein [Anaeroplasmataceae bacterium]